MRIISLLFNFSVPRTHPCRYSTRLAYTVPPVSPTPLLTDPPSPRRSAAGCTKTETFPALYPRAWTVYEGHISGVMIFVDTSGESLRKMQNSGNSVGGYILPRARRPDGVHGVLLHHKTASEQSLLTFAIAAEETEYVHISECPVFVISGSHKGISAKDMWHEVKQVMDLLSDFIDLCFFEMSMFDVITINLFILYSGCVAPYKLSLCSKHFITQVGDLNTVKKQKFVLILLPVHGLISTGGQFKIGMAELIK
ncbi:unnamed protein product [Vicia faba]|uniref:Uncharacterized protein n=1 Tax=Vicia faba TaxID=3906 RepID=A0AAV1AXQ5_VICFA|nr:unnamed protein product [Vicia faba]